MHLQLVSFSCFLAIASTLDEINFEPKANTSDVFKIHRVIGGTNAAKGEFPHQVSLQSAQRPFNYFSHFCGGSIIDKYWILTAAHCVGDLPPNAQVVVKAGKNLVSTRETTEQTSQVSNIYVHHAYDGEVSPYDIALIRLTNPFSFNQFVRPIKLPVSNTVPEGNVVLSGWGSISMTHEAVLPEKLQKVTLPIIDLQKCKMAMRMKREPWQIGSTNVCTGPLTGGYSACNGDSGGPLIRQNENGETELIGIVSWGLVPCASVGAPAVFVRVSAFIDWINNFMRI